MSHPVSRAASGNPPPHPPPRPQAPAPGLSRLPFGHALTGPYPAEDPELDPEGEAMGCGLGARRVHSGKSSGGIALDAGPLPHSPWSGKLALGLFKLWDPAYPEGLNQTIR